jgi:hypothetical protein
MENARYRNDVFRIVGKRGRAGANTKCTDSNPQECFGAAISDNRQKVGTGRSVAVRLYLSCCSHWRSLGETAGNFRNADKIERAVDVVARLIGDNVLAANSLSRTDPVRQTTSRPKV